MENRTLVIGDVHGCSKTFNRLLDVIRLERTDTLYLLGDLIDRGPDSKGVIDTILQLQKDGFRLLSVLGNHESLALNAIETGVYEDYLDWEDNGGEETLKSYGVRTPKEIPTEHIEFMNSLPLYRMTDKLVFVHAGLDWALPDEFSKAGETAMLWSRSGKVIPKRIGGRTLVTGHTTRTLDEIRRSLTTKHILTDNGCHLGTGFTEGKGNLVAINLDTGELTVQPNIDGADHDHH